MVIARVALASGAAIVPEILYDNLLQVHPAKSVCCLTTYLVHYIKYIFLIQHTEVGQVKQVFRVANHFISLFLITIILVGMRGDDFDPAVPIRSLERALVLVPLQLTRIEPIQQGISLNAFPVQRVVAANVVAFHIAYIAVTNIKPHGISLTPY
jgi:hypothetical protein